MNNPTPIDWSVFDKDPTSLVECRCGREYRSHIKYRDGAVHTRTPCPACKASIGHVRAARSDWQRWP